MPITQRIKPIETTITSGTDTEIIDLQNRIIVGVRTPASIASTSFIIQESATIDGDFLPLYNSNAQYGSVGDFNFNCLPSKSVYVPAFVTESCRFIKLVFNASETSKTFEILTREIN